jgi:hypothetical protein
MGFTKTNETVTVKGKTKNITKYVYTKPNSRIKYILHNKQYIPYKPDKDVQQKGGSYENIKKDIESTTESLKGVYEYYQDTNPNEHIKYINDILRQKILPIITTLNEDNKMLKNRLNTLKNILIDRHTKIHEFTLSAMNILNTLLAQKEKLNLREILSIIKELFDNIFKNDELISKQIKNSE